MSTAVAPPPGPDRHGAIRREASPGLRRSAWRGHAGNDMRPGIAARGWESGPRIGLGARAMVKARSGDTSRSSSGQACITFCSYAAPRSGVVEW